MAQCKVWFRAGAASAERTDDANDPLRKSLAMWLYGFIGYPPRHIAIAPASVGVPQANSGKTLRKSTCKGFWLWLAERKLHPLGAMLRQQSGRSIAQASRVWCRTCTLRAKTTKHSYTRAWAWVMISSSPTKKSFPDGYAQTQCGTGRYRFPNPRRQFQTTRRRLGARKDWRSYPYFIARRHSAFSSHAAWKMRATSLRWSVCMTEPRTSY